MENNINKKTFLFFAFILSVICITIISLSPVAGKNNQLASVSAASKTETSQKDISGKRVIGITIKEDFLGSPKKENHSDDVIQKIFIDGKSYNLETENINLEFKTGIYDVKGSLDLKTGIVKISDARFLGNISDGTQNKNLTILPVKDNLTKIKPKKVAVFLFDHTDTATQPFYPSDIEEIMFGNGNFKKYFREASYGRQQITGDAFGWFTIPQNVGNGLCQANPEQIGNFIQDGEGINLNEYTNFVIITLCNGAVANGSSNTGPLPYIINGNTYNKTVSWVNISESKWNMASDQMSQSAPEENILTNLEHLLIHEFGHALGLFHAHGISCQGNTSEENCSGVGLGNYFDVMSYNTIGLHLNAWSKAKLGWFINGELKIINQSGIYEIKDLARGNMGGQISQTPIAYRIRPSVNSIKTPIWIEFRNAYGFDSGINTQEFEGEGDTPPFDISENKNGIMIYKEGFEGMFSGQINPKTARLMYLRNSPNTENPNPYQVSLNPGETYEEPRYGLSITSLSSNDPNKRRFQVNLNPNLACTRLNPKVDYNFLGNSVIQPGGTTFVKVNIKNMDYISCPNSNLIHNINFGNNLSQSGGLNNLSNLLSNMSSDDERSFSFGIYSNPSTLPGTYAVSVSIQNQSSALSSTIEIPVTIQ